MEKSPIQPVSTPAKFFSDREEAFIKSVFSGPEGEVNLKTLRKALIPSYDPEGSIGVAIDLWTGENYEQMMPDVRELAILSRIKFMNSVERTLVMLKSVANRVDETPQQIAERNRKNSTR